MNRKDKYLTILLVFLLVVQLVGAASFNHFKTENSGELCPRNTGLNKYTIKNVGSETNVYSFSLSGNAASWSTVLPLNMVLKSQESNGIFVYSTPTTTVSPGSYNLDINVASQGEVSKIAENIVVKDCYGVGFNVEETSKEVCPGDIAKFKINVRNDGEYEDVFNLKLEGQLSDNSKLSDSILKLKKGANKDVFININSPKDVAGEYGLSLVVSSDKEVNSIPLILNVNSCYRFDFGIIGNKNSYNMCERKIEQIQFSLGNKGTTYNEYSIELEGPVWARVNKESIGLWPNEVKHVDLIVAPDYGVKGNFDVKLKVIPKRGDLTSVSSLNINVRKCNSVDTSIGQEEVRACVGLNNDFHVNVKNDGENSKVYKAELDAPSWVTINSPTQFDLQPNRETTVLIRAAPTDDVDLNKYNVKVKIQAADDSGVTANDEEELKVEVIGEEQCYEPKVSSLYNDVVVYYDSSVSIPLTIKNNGIRNVEYKLSLSGEKNFVKLNKESLILDPTESETVYLYVAPSVDFEFRNYEAFVTLSLNDGTLLDTQKFDIEVTNQTNRATNILPPGVEGKGVGVLEKIKDFGNDIKKIFLENKIPFIVGIVAVLLVVLLLILGWHKPIIEFFDEDFEEEDTKKKERKPKKKKSAKEELDTLKKGV